MVTLHVILIECLFYRNYIEFEYLKISCNQITLESVLITYLLITNAFFIVNRKILHKNALKSMQTFE